MTLLTLKRWGGGAIALRLTVTPYDCGNYMVLVHYAEAGLAIAN